MEKSHLKYSKIDDFGVPPLLWKPSYPSISPNIPLMDGWMVDGYSQKKQKMDGNFSL